MNALQLLEDLRDRGVQLGHEDGRLRIRAPRGVLETADREALKAHRDDIVRLLSGDEGHDDQPSLQQERLWFLDRVDPGTAAYTLPAGYYLDGPLDRAALAEALTRFARRHELASVHFREEQGEPRVVHEPAAPLPLEFTSVEELGLESESELVAWMEEDRPLPLDRPGLFRVTVVQVNPTRHLLFLVAHHSVWDGWCFDLFLEEMAAHYAAARSGVPTGLAPLEKRYRDFAREQRQAARGQTEAYWSRVLEGPLPSLELPSDRPRPPEMTYAGRRVWLDVPADVLAGIRSLAREQRVTVAHVLLTLFKVLLYRFTGQDDLVVGVPVQGRLRPEYERVAGFFVNTVPIRSGPRPGSSFEDYLRQVSTRMLEGLEYQGVPFERLVQRFAQRDLSRTPLFQAMFAHQFTAGRVERWDTLRVTPVSQGTHSVQTDLCFWVREYGDRMDGGMDYRTDLLSEETARRLANALVTLARDVVAEPGRPLEEAALLAPPDRAWLSEKGEGPVRDAGGESVLDAVRTRCRATPEAVAVRSASGEALTYAELWSRAGDVAAFLSELGVEPGSVVGVHAERDLGALPLFLGVWRAGAAYLPLDPGYPRDRLAFMVEDAGAREILGSGTPPSDLPGRVHALSDIPRSDLDPPPGPDSQALAYLLYTSGSTGRPKGVEVSHGSLLNLVDAVGDRVGFEAEDVLVAVTTFSFDIAGLELWLPLVRGGRVELASEEESRDGEWLADRLTDTGATVMQATPATWRMLLDAGWDGGLRVALCGGETFPPELANGLRTRCSTLWNVYGPTETTIWSTAHRVDAPVEGSVPIGGPLANTRLYVMDPGGRLVPPGVAGELWIGGAGVARGYRRRPEADAERFVPDPFRPGQRVYRTGDRVRWREDGTLEHQGRQDRQVKVHGHRIEPGEVEAALEAQPGVHQALVLVRGTGLDARLVGYLVAEGGAELSGSELRRSVRERLPDYMVPGVLTSVPAIPLLPNGKVDRDALPDPLVRSRRRANAAPETPAERAVAHIWAELLGRDDAGVEDNFFELGGHSLLAIRAVSRLQNEADLHVDPRSFFFMSLGQIAASARRAGGAEGPEAA